MRINFNSKDAVFAIKAENEEEKAQLKTSAAVAIPAQVDGFGHLVLRLQTDRNGLLVCHDGSFQYVSGGSGAVRSAMM